MATPACQVWARQLGLHWMLAPQVPPEDAAFIAWMGNRKTISLLEFSSKPIPGISLAPDALATSLTSGQMVSVFNNAVIQSARGHIAHKDFKILLDLEPTSIEAKDLAPTPDEATSFKTTDNAPESEVMKSRQNVLRWLLQKVYRSPELARFPELTKPRWTLPEGNPHKKALDYVESQWTELLRHSREKEGVTLLSAPYPYLVPAGRFTEWYYWDTYFGVLGLLESGRLEIAKMQVENLLFQVSRYGFIPNGGRIYYLSRSQPEVLSMTVRAVFDAAWEAATSEPERDELKDWLKTRALPLMKASYSFWREGVRHTPSTQLSRHYDSLEDVPRPERFSEDKDHENPLTFRAQAESGLDFTRSLGENTHYVNGVLLNSFLWRTEMDIAELSELVGDLQTRDQMKDAAVTRAAAIRRYLWNSERGVFQNYDFAAGKRIDVLSAETFAPLYVGMLTPDEAARVRQATMAGLLGPGGLKSSEHSPGLHQWEGENMWMPLVEMATSGLNRYGYRDEAQTIATRAITTVQRAFDETGSFFERYDAESGSIPKDDGKKYPVQPGFLWTNAIWYKLLKNYSEHSPQKIVEIPSR